jgi:hypothetical protein
MKQGNHTKNKGRAVAGVFCFMGAVIFEGLAYGDISTAAYLTMLNMVRWGRAGGDIQACR